MQTTGIVLIVLGVLGGVCGLMMDTTIAAADGSRVHNLGLLAQQQAIVAFSAAAFLGGVVLSGLASLALHIGERFAQHPADRRASTAPVIVRQPAASDGGMAEDEDSQAMGWLGSPPPSK